MVSLLSLLLAPLCSFLCSMAAASSPDSPRLRPHLPGTLRSSPFPLSPQAVSCPGDCCLGCPLSTSHGKHSSPPSKAWLSSAPS